LGFAKYTTKIANYTTQFLKDNWVSTLLQRHFTFQNQSRTHHQMVGRTSARTHKRMLFYMYTKIKFYALEIFTV